MRPVTQVTHDDCFRACVASIFEMPLEAVPHFYRDGRVAISAMPELREWCEQFGVAPIVLAMQDVSLQVIVENLEVLNPGLYFILSGVSLHGTRHAVVCCGGRIVHDPAPAAEITASRLALGCAPWLRHGIAECPPGGTMWSAIYFGDLRLAYGKGRRSATLPVAESVVRPGPFSASELQSNWDPIS